MRAVPAIDLGAYVDAQCGLLGLRLAPEHRPGVLRHLQIVADAAQRVMEFELAPADEPGNVFIPVSPQEPK